MTAFKAPFLLWAIQLIAVGLLPAMALLVSGVKMQGWKYLIVLECFMGGVLVFYSIYGQIDMYLIRFYGIISMIFLFLMTIRLGPNNFNRALSITMLFSFVLTEYWEIPVFMAGFLGLLDMEYSTWINQLYLLLALVLLFYEAGLKINPITVLYFLIPLSLSAIIIVNFPLPIYAGGFWYMSRFITFVFLGLGVLFEVKK